MRSVALLDTVRSESSYPVAEVGDIAIGFSEFSSTHCSWCSRRFLRTNRWRLRR